MYRELNAAKLVESAEVLAARIKERFPEAGLTAVAHDLTSVAKRTVRISYQLDRPLWAMRLLAGVVAVGLISLIVFGGLKMQISTHIDNYATLFQGLESLINDVVYTGIAIWFVCSIERRVKRSRLLKLISQLRSLAHVIDMHQLDKDPDRLDPEFTPMLRSPKPKLTRMALTRYLDYCSDMLSILAKLAALTVQRFEDPVALAAVNELETLSDGLSRKVWQKIMILDRMGGHEEPTAITVPTPVASTPA